LHLENYFRAYCECTNSEELKKWKEKLKQNLGKDYDDYAVAYDWTERKLGALKSKKPYEPLVDAYTYNGGKHPDGCTLCGERAHLAVDWEKFKENLQKDIKHYLKEGEKLCGVCLVKRFAFYYLGRQTFPSVHDIANAKFKEELKDFEQRHKDRASEAKVLASTVYG
jgi:CRISPR-associated protein Cmr2